MRVEVRHHLPTAPTRGSRGLCSALGRLVLVLVFMCRAQLASAQVVEYYHLDALGSVRAITNQAGAVIERHDYLPFGEEWTPQPTADPRKFTGKERDAETGLDYLGARYYSSQTGRFTTVDPVVPIEDALLDPQRWNRYSYVMNRPLVLTDPDGRCPYCLAQRLAQLAAQLASRYGTQAYNWATRFFNSPTGQEVMTAAGETITGAQMGPTGPRVIPTGDIDVAAIALARKLGGQASVRIEGFEIREFDAISDAFVGQTFGGRSALLKPDNFLSKNRRDQIRATLEAAKATGRKAYFEFRDGAHDNVLDFIRRNAERIGAEFDVSR